MYAAHKEQMTTDIANSLHRFLGANSPGPELLRPAIMEGLNNYWDDTIIAVAWTANDIKNHAKNIDVRITMKDAKKILALLLNEYDSAVGINWDTIEDAINFYKAG